MLNETSSYSSYDGEERGITSTKDSGIDSHEDYYNTTGGGGSHPHNRLSMITHRGSSANVHRLTPPSEERENGTHHNHRSGSREQRSASRGK